MNGCDLANSFAQERAWIEVDVAAFRHNLKALQAQLSPQTKLMAVIKADAYGHGAVWVSRVAQQCGVQAFGVATVLEGIQLRQAGIQQPILILGAVQSRGQIEAMVHWQLEPTLCTPEQAQLFSQALSQSLPVHLKIDTGMSRLGQPWHSAVSFVQQVQRLPHLSIASIYSHLATADAPDPSFMKIQQARFEQVIEGLAFEADQRPMFHLANSAATLFHPAFHYDQVRVGLALYGIYPGPQFQDSIDLQPVMQVKARITHLKDLPEGVGVSYSHSFTTTRPTRMAVVGIGYADGVPRPLSNRMRVLVQGQYIPQIGTITMDQLMIDVTDVPTVQIGEVVTLLGRDHDSIILADEWAQQLGTIPYEIVCGFQQRLTRIEIND
jgi:alanine racemase